MRGTFRERIATQRGEEQERAVVVDPERPLAPGTLEPLGHTGVPLERRDELFEHAMVRRCAGPDPRPPSGDVLDEAAHGARSPSISKSFRTVFQFRVVTAPRSFNLPIAPASTLRACPFGYQV